MEWLGGLSSIASSLKVAEAAAKLWAWQTEAPAGSPALTVGSSAEQKQCPEIRVFLTWARDGVQFARERRLLLLSPEATLADTYRVAAAAFTPPPPAKPLLGGEPKAAAPPEFIGAADANGFVMANDSKLYQISQNCTVNLFIRAAERT